MLVTSASFEVDLKKCFGTFPTAPDSSQGNPVHLLSFLKVFPFFWPHYNINSSSSKFCSLWHIPFYRVDVLPKKIFWGKRA